MQMLENYLLERSSLSIKWVSSEYDSVLELFSLLSDAKVVKDESVRGFDGEAFQSP